MRTAIVLCLIAVAAGVCDAQWVQTNGPYGGPASCFAAIGTNLFAGVPGGGVFRSTNGGASWTVVNTGLANTTVFALAASDTNLFAGTDGYFTGVGGVFRSTNNGTSWTQTGLPSRLVLDLAVSGTNLFAGTWGGVFLSTNGGATWAEVDSGLTDPYVHALVVSGTNLFAGTGAPGYDGVIFLTTNNGTNWTAVDSGLTCNTVMALAAIPPDSSGTASLFAGTESGIFLTTNNGASWSVADSGLTNTYVTALATSGTNLFAGTYGSGVFLSTNIGKSWRGVNSGLIDMGVYSLGSIGTSLFVGTGCGVFVSPDNGQKWTPVRTVGNPSVHVTALAAKSAELFAAAAWGWQRGNPDLLSGTDWGGLGNIPMGRGVFHSTDNGQSWMPLVAICATSFVVQDDNIFASTLGGGVFLSTNNGASWCAVNGGLTWPYVMTLAASGTNLFAGTWGRGVFLSTNNGTNWTPVDTGLTVTYVQALATSGTNLFAGTYGSGVFLSTNSGTSWRGINSGLIDMRVLSLGSFGTDLFAGTCNGAFLSTNNGTSWTQSGLTGESVLALAAYGTNLFASTCPDGVFLSTNDGTSWQSVAAGLPQNSTCPGVISDHVGPLAFSNGYVFVGTGHSWFSEMSSGDDGAGVWKRPLSEVIAAVDPGPSEVLHEFSLQQNYPNPFNPSTTIHYALPHTSFVTLTVYNTLGQQVAQLVNEQQQAGNHDTVFRCDGLASGVYFYRLEAGSFTNVKKLVLLK